MKVDALYDVFCDLCGRKMSSDFLSGLCDSAKDAEKEAFRIGFIEINGKRICPICQKNHSIRLVSVKKKNSPRKYAVKLQK